MTSSLLLTAWTVLIFWSIGQIWFVQLVIYPLFGRVGTADYIDYHRYYTRHIPLPVIVPGFLCFVGPVALAIWGPAGPDWMSITNIAAGLVGLAVTVGLEIPRHNRLERGGKDVELIAELVRFNWPRTLSLSVQGAVTLSTLRVLIDAG